jgi:hypothetical protein
VIAWLLLSSAPESPVQARRGDEEIDPEEIIDLKSRRYLNSLLKDSRCPPHPRRQRNSPKKSTVFSVSHHSIIPGYIPFSTLTSSPFIHRKATRQGDGNDGCCRLGCEELGDECHIFSDCLFDT